MKRKELNPAFRVVILAAIIIVAFIFAIRYSFSVLKSADYFKIKEVIVRPESAADLSYLIGNNIFNIDLRQESRHILQAYSEYKRIFLVRILPNRLFADFIRRKPLALVKLYKYFALDNEGVLFTTDLKPEENGLPVITGLETKIFGPKSGTRYNLLELQFAFKVMGEASKNRSTKNYPIKKIDVSGDSNATIFIALPQLALQGITKGPAIPGQGVLEVRIGQSDTTTKIASLATILEQYKKELRIIKYIDLRFKEPLIKLNDPKIK